MNKTERDKLANIVSAMIYSFDSSRQAKDFGEQIIEMFPVIKDDLEAYRYVTATYNVTSAIRSALRRQWDDSLLNRDISALHEQTHGNVEGVLDTYLESLNKDVDAFLYGIEERIAGEGRFGIWGVLSELIGSAEWQEAVSAFYRIGTSEYKYLTYSKE
jgi:hypothetical protein